MHNNGQRNAALSGGGISIDQAKIQENLKSHFQNKVMVVDAVDK